jgi:DNA repair exonuclease SbcCD ATPase subunit
MVQFCNSTDVERKAIFEKILQDLDAYDIYYQSSKEQLAGAIATVDTYKQSIEVEERELSVVKKVIESEEEKAEEYEARKQDKIKKIENELIELEKKVDIRRNLTERRHKYVRVTHKLNGWLEQHPVADDKYYTLKQQLSDVDIKIEKLSVSDRCAECNQPITEKHRERERKRLEGLKGVIVTTLIEYEIWQDRKRMVQDKYEEIKEKTDELKFKLTKYDTVQERTQELAEELESLREESNGNEETLKRWRSKARKLSKLIANYQRKIKEAEKDRLYLEEVVRGFSKTGIPNVIISRALYLLEQRVNEYLDTLTNGSIGISLSGFTTTKTGAVRNKIGIDVVSASGVTTYESYSGGERQRLNIAMLLALRDVAQANKGVSLNCLFLDEVLDLSLDSQGANDVLLLLQQKKKDIESIFIISPKEEFIKNSSGNFDTSFVVSKEDGFSKIIGG